MKKTQLIITVLMLFAGFTSGQEPIDGSTLVEKDGLMYAPDSDKPYSGVAVEYYENGQKMEEGTFKDGELINEIKYLRGYIIDLLKKHGSKMPASDIDAHLKHQDLDEIKKLCKKMYQDGEISYAGNGRYFVLTEESNKKEEKKTAKPKQSSAPKSDEVDVEKELEKYKGLLDKGLITQEDYDAKKKELLGL